MAGLNRFEHVECAYCLNSFYVTPSVVSQAIQDIEASTERYDVKIKMDGEPRRRHVGVDLPDGRAPILPWIAQQALEQAEADVVLQAVGRVRPFTRPREVIVIQAGALPGVDYTHEFRNLEQARTYFEIRTLASTARDASIQVVLRLKAQGFSKKSIARKLDVSLSTVKRYLRLGRGS